MLSLIKLDPLLLLPLSPLTTSAMQTHSDRVEHTLTIQRSHALRDEVLDVGAEVYLSRIARGMHNHQNLLHPLKSQYNSPNKIRTLSPKDVLRRTSPPFKPRAILPSNVDKFLSASLSSINVKPNSPKIITLSQESQARVKHDEKIKAAKITEAAAAEKVRLEEEEEEEEEERKWLRKKIIHRPKRSPPVPPHNRIFRPSVTTGDRRLRDQRMVKTLQNLLYSADNSTDNSIDNSIDNSTQNSIQNSIEVKEEKEKLKESMTKPVIVFVQEDKNMAKMTKNLLSSTKYTGISFTTSKPNKTSTSRKKPRRKSEMKEFAQIQKNTNEKLQQKCKVSPSRTVIPLPPWTPPPPPTDPTVMPSKAASTVTSNLSVNTRTNVNISPNVSLNVSPNISANAKKKRRRWSALKDFDQLLLQKNVTSKPIVGSERRNKIMIPTAPPAPTAPPTPTAPLAPTAPPAPIPSNSPKPVTKKEKISAKKSSKSKRSRRRSSVRKDFGQILKGVQFRDDSSSSSSKDVIAELLIEESYHDSEARIPPPPPPPGVLAMMAMLVEESATDPTAPPLHMI